MYLKLIGEWMLMKHLYIHPCLLLPYFSLPHSRKVRDDKNIIAMVTSHMTTLSTWRAPLHGQVIGVEVNPGTTHIATHVCVHSQPVITGFLLMYHKTPLTPHPHQPPLGTFLDKMRGRIQTHQKKIKHIHSKHTNPTHTNHVKCS